MQIKTTLTLIAAACALFAGQAFAASHAAKEDRAKVKEETKAAVKKGDTAKAGEATPGAAAPMAKSDKARADVKADTKAAVKKGETPKAGEAAPAAAPMAKSDKARADVKAETKAAVKKGETPKAGEAPTKQ